jgi:hypothetical protein
MNAFADVADMLGVLRSERGRLIGRPHFLVN